MRARGLKQTCIPTELNGQGESRPVRARGLKPQLVLALEVQRQRRAPCGRVD